MSYRAAVALGQVRGGVFARLPDGRDAQQRLRAYFETYNSRRLHQSLDYRTPDEVYFGTDPVPEALAA